MHRIGKYLIIGCGGQLAFIIALLHSHLSDRSRLSRAARATHLLPLESRRHDRSSPSSQCSTSISFAMVHRWGCSSGWLLDNLTQQRYSPSLSWPKLDRLWERWRLSNLLYYNHSSSAAARGERTSRWCCSAKKLNDFIAMALYMASAQLTRIGRNRMNSVSLLDK